MPCPDVAETIRIVLDPDDRLKSYSYRKDACGRDVGEGPFLLSVLRGFSVEDILRLTFESLVDHFPSGDAIEEFLKCKHLAALQSALRVLAGHEPGGPDGACAPASVACEGGDVVITARIRVDVPTAPIKPCHACPACGPVPKGVRL